MDGQTDKIDSSQDASFLPDDYLRRKRERRANAFCAALFITATATVGGVFFVTEADVRAVEARHAEVSARYAEEAERIRAVQAMQAKQRSMARRAELTASLLEKVPRSYLLARVTNALPPGASLIELDLKAKQRKGPAGGASAKTAYERRRRKADAPAGAEATALAYDVTVKVTGMAETDEQVSGFLHALNDMRLFDPRHSGAAATEAFVRDGRPMRRFEFEMALAPDAAAESPDKIADDVLAGIDTEGATP